MNDDVLIVSNDNSHIQAIYEVLIEQRGIEHLYAVQSAQLKALETQNIMLVIILAIVFIRSILRGF